ncbi:hypothetical protein D3C71_1595310 [compost metagenome]
MYLAPLRVPCFRFCVMSTASSVSCPQCVQPPCAATCRLPQAGQTFLRSNWLRSACSVTGNRKRVDTSSAKKAV